MNLNLQDKKIIVTGGAKGIGAGIVTALAKEGAFPLIIDRDNKSALELIQKIGKGDHLSVDLSKPDICVPALEEFLSKHGQVDGLVNNAGINDSVSLEHGSYSLFLQSLEKNLTHYFISAKAALPYLIKSKGAIVNITSKVAETGQGNTSGYAAANGGRNALTREWAVELLKYSIRVNAVVVAECFTDMYETWLNGLPDPQAVLDKIKQRVPLEKRMTRVDEISNMVIFLLSNCASHTTGELIHVDGGYVHLDRAIE